MSATNGHSTQTTISVTISGQLCSRRIVTATELIVIAPWSKYGQLIAEADVWPKR
jgi:hypothetical protein